MRILIFFFDNAYDEDEDSPHVLHFFELPLGAKPLEARGEAANISINYYTETLINSTFNKEKKINLSRISITSF